MLKNSAIASAAPPPANHCAIPASSDDQQRLLADPEQQPSGHHHAVRLADRGQRRADEAEPGRQQRGPRRADAVDQQPADQRQRNVRQAKIAFSSPICDC